VTSVQQCLLAASLSDDSLRSEESLSEDIELPTPPPDSRTSSPGGQLWKDIDWSEAQDPLFSAEYSPDIFAYMRKREVRSGEGEGVPSPSLWITLLRATWCQSGDNMMPVRGPAMCIVYTCVSRPNFSTWLEEGAYELPRRSLWVVFICSWWKEPGGLHVSLLFRWLARTNSVETVAHGIIDNIYYLWWDTSCSVAILTSTQSDRKIRVQFPGKVPIGHPS